MTNPLRANDDSTIASRAFDAIESRTGIDYALRTIQQSQVQLSMMADTKASIMMTVCSIVISASLTQLDRPGWRVPLFVLDGFTAISLVAALVCVLPSTRRPPTKAGAVDVASPGFNPFFFMHFRHLGRDEFEHEVWSRVARPSDLYHAILGDIYAAGCVLAQAKYRYLCFSYVSFMVGLLAALAALVWQLASNHP